LNKTLKILLILLVLLTLACILSCALMASTKFCPPQGPWPVPPWCEPAEAAEMNEMPAPLLDLAEEIVPQINELLPTPELVPYILPAEMEAVFSGEEWTQNPSLPSDFMLGHTFMDIYGNGQYPRYVSSTMDSMIQAGSGWVVFDNYWSYHSLEPPVIRPFPDRMGFRDASAEEIKEMVTIAHEKGLKFALMMELNWDVMAGPWVSWEESQRFWTESQEFLHQKAMDIESNTAYWDAWFASYTEFALNQAAVAEESGADMLVIGKQINGAVNVGNMDRWKQLIAEVRKVYSGPISYASYTFQDYSQAEEFPYEDMDVIILYLYNQIHEEDQPDITALVSAFEQYHDNQFEPLSKRFNKPILFLTPFQSRDFGAKQEWFEPAAPAPEVGEDLLIQAKLYEALFQSIQDEDWVAGVWTWGYWWRDEFYQHQPDDSSFIKSSSVRNKPAMWIIKKWADSILPPS